ncbi:restriction endonuclease FokI C-terminal domain-containing protein [Lachnospira eligens]|uniref:Type-2 restriction enzyme FokI n=1 Tax=Lachnospira eligens TaxID=39485 RepID=A0A174ZHP4_9FIRM|nr:restriction endonuclease FokI C-terminal domain-containing protein [Lachnospira eligens]CUQ85367.1 Type-2 restriction enzyme FokI [Lachnospira eligens]
MAVKRTFGWVQNPGDLKKLKKVVGIFTAGSAENLDLVSNKLPLLLTYGLISNDDYNDFIAELNKTDIEIDYSKLKGKGSGSRTRKDAICTGIIQAIIEAQQNKTYSDVAGNSITIKKPYTDDWTAEGFLRWAISCGLLEYVKDDDKCKITPLGEELANAPDNSPAETEALTKALLSYPPVIRILSLLEAQDEQTKFDLGSKLGFKGEMGFTSMPQDAYLCDYCEATTAGERTNVRSNEEGDSDKYARGIASWCMQMGWVESNQKDVTETYRRKSYTAKLQTYSITRKGEKALIKARGNSSNPRLARVLMFEMLASNKVSSANYLRFVRACIIKALTSSDKSTDQLKKALKGYELDVDDTAIKDHIEGLISIGLEITENAGKYRLLDKIECLEIPARTECVKDNVVDIKDRVRNKLIHLDHKYLALIDLAYSDAASRAKKNADAREFEIQTADLFTKELSFNGQRLGDSRKPDVIISYGLDGTIVDNKSYKDGFNISRTCADEMSRYINENNLRQKSLNPNEWWKNFDSTITAYTFLFITSYLKGQFEDQLEYVSNANGGIKGAAIGVESLLYLSEGIKAGRISHADFYSNFNNKEMIYTA